MFNCMTGKNKTTLVLNSARTSRFSRLECFNNRWPSTIKTKSNVCLRLNLQVHNKLLYIQLSLQVEDLELSVSIPCSYGSLNVHKVSNVSHQVFIAVLLLIK